VAAGTDAPVITIRPDERSALATAGARGAAQAAFVETLLYRTLEELAEIAGALDSGAPQTPRRPGLDAGTQRQGRAASGASRTVVVLSMEPESPRSPERIRGSPWNTSGAASAGTTGLEACASVIPAWIAGIQWPRKALARPAEASRSSPSTFPPVSRTNRHHRSDPSQFSVSKCGTRLNSARLSVTNTAPKARPWAAIQKSFAPIGVPLRSSRARISA